jgi:hypothetical protein
MQKEQNLKKNSLKIMKLSRKKQEDGYEIQEEGEKEEDSSEKKKVAIMKPKDINLKEIEIEMKKPSLFPPTSEVEEENSEMRAKHIPMTNGTFGNFS